MLLHINPSPGYYLFDFGLPPFTLSTLRPPFSTPSGVSDLRVRRTKCLQNRKNKKRLLKHATRSPVVFSGVTRARDVAVAGDRSLARYFILASSSSIGQINRWNKCRVLYPLYVLDVVRFCSTYPPPRRRIRLKSKTINLLLKKLSIQNYNTSGPSNRIRAVPWTRPRRPTPGHKF